MKEILERLGRVIEESSVEDVDWSKVDENTTIDSLGFDSLAILDLLYDIEQEFGISIDAKDVVDVRTVGAMASLIDKRIKS
jgi:acyl carrier protein